MSNVGQDLKRQIVIKVATWSPTQQRCSRTVAKIIIWISGYFTNGWRLIFYMLLNARKMNWPGIWNKSGMFYGSEKYVACVISLPLLNLSTGEFFIFQGINDDTLALVQWALSSTFKRAPSLLQKCPKAAKGKWRWINLCTLVTWMEGLWDSCMRRDILGFLNTSDYEGKEWRKLHLFDKFLGEMYILVAAVVLTPCQGLGNIELSGMCMCIEKGNCGKNRIQGKTLSSAHSSLISQIHRHLRNT